MDPYYTSPSYYYQSLCPLHDSHVDPYCTYPNQSTPIHPSSSYYYPSCVSQPLHEMIPYNNSTSNVYPQSTPPSLVQTVKSAPVLNATFVLTPPVGHRRRQRTVFSKDQVDLLDQVFEKNRYPDVELREELSQKLDVPEARIQVWFKNRRSRARTTCKTIN